MDFYQAVASVKLLDLQLLQHVLGSGKKIADCLSLVLVSGV